MSKALRTFIRETLLINELGGSMSQDMRYDPLGSHSKSSQQVLNGATKNNNFVGDAFSLTAGGPVKFIVVADKQGREAIVLSHRNAVESDFSSSIFRPIVLRAGDTYDDGSGPVATEFINDPVVKSIEENALGWNIDDDANNSSLFDTFKVSYEASRRTPGRPVRSNINTSQIYYAINDLLTALNQKKIFLPEGLYDPKVQQKALNFECVIPFEEAWKYVNEADPKSAKFLLGAACFYEYASSIWAPLAAAAVGAALGAAIAAPTGETAAVATVPVLAMGGAMAAEDLFFRWPVIRWAIANDKLDFAISNAIFLCLSFLPLGAGGLVARTFLGRAITKAMERPVKFMVMQLLTSMAFDAGKPIDESALNVRIDTLYADEDSIKQNLSASEAELTNMIKKNYSFKEQLPGG
jgi:hypothetical protein